MRYAAWESRMSTPDKNGSTPRDSWRLHARRGREEAIAMLDGPPMPPALEYLWTWYLDIRRGLGTGMDGGSLTWAALDAWCRWTGRNPEPFEVDALFSIDAAMRHPEIMEEAA